MRMTSEKTFPWPNSGPLRKDLSGSSPLAANQVCAAAEPIGRYQICMKEMGGLCAKWAISVCGLSKRRYKMKLTILLCGLLLGLMTVWNVAADDSLGEKLGKQIDRTVNQLGEDLRQEWNSLRGSIERMGVQGRVYGRLHWDNALK